MHSSNDVLFLDIDGVLHPFAPGMKDFIFMDEFVSTVNKFPNVDIVICSDWRKHKSFYEIVNEFPTSIRHRIIGVTPVLDEAGQNAVMGIRSIEAELWLSMNGCADCDWVAVDDDMSLWRPGTNLVKCDDQFKDAEIAQLEYFLTRFQIARSNSHLFESRKRKVA